MITGKQWLKLHPMTQIMSACAALGVVMTVVNLVRGVRPIIAYGQTGGGELIDVITRAAFDFVWSMGFVGTAALIEVMFRIWRELERANAGDAS